MTPYPEPLNNLKEKLLAQCRALIVTKIDTTKSAIQLLQEAANEETKSSAGDKYETGRAMAQIEIENLNAQLNEQLKLLRTLEAIKQEKSDHVTLGSAVVTTLDNYFLAVNVGKVTVDGIVYVTISTSAPLAQKLLGKTIGDTFDHLSKSQKILDVL